MKKLETEKAEKVEMAQQLKKLQAEIEAMKTTRAVQFTKEKDVTEEESADFEIAPSASSTRYGRPLGSLEESRFLSSVNQLSISSIAVPECKPAEGDDEIHRQRFEMWRDLLIDCMTLAGIEDELTKFTVFKVKAGPRLLTIFKNTKSDAEAPDANTNPFSNALHRLKLYFGSGSDVMFQRRKLALMEQKADESDLAFITRVGETAQLCDFDKTKEFEEIVKTIAEHAKCKEVRVAALKMVSRNGTFTELVDKIREIQAIRMNEEFFAVKHGQHEATLQSAILAPVSVNVSKQWTPRRNFIPKAGRYLPYSRYNSRNNQRFGQQVSRTSNSIDSTRRNENRNNYDQADRCWRCFSFFHLPSECGAANLVCRKCGRLGHIQRACQPSITGNIKRVASKEISEIETKHPRSDEADDKEAVSKSVEQVSDQFEN